MKRQTNLKKMKIAFDLDDTLLGSYFIFEPSSLRFKLVNMLYPTERLRLGTIELFEYCYQRNFEIYIYTSSYRKQSYIRTLFWKYGLKLNRIINQSIHNKYLKGSGNQSSKYPPIFGIDILVDNSKGVVKEGEMYNFKVLWADPDSKNWSIDLIKELEKY
jgi:hypothetical protein